MLAVTLHQPWAQLIATGDKQIETRTWEPTGVYRDRVVGQRLAIHAGLTLHPYARRRYADSPVMQAALRAEGYEALEDLPLGAVVAIATVADVVTVEHLDNMERLLGRHIGAPHERSFGNYDDPGGFCWLLRDVVALDPPEPATGRQGFWPWAQEVAA